MPSAPAALPAGRSSRRRPASGFDQRIAHRLRLGRAAPRAPFIFQLPATSGRIGSVRPLCRHVCPPRHRVPFMKSVHIKHQRWRLARRRHGKLAKPQRLRFISCHIPGHARISRAAHTPLGTQGMPCAAPAATSQRNDHHNARRSATRLHWMDCQAALCASRAELRHLGRRRRVHGLGPRRARQGRQPRDPRRGLSARLPERDQPDLAAGRPPHHHRAGARRRASTTASSRSSSPGRRSRRTPTSSAWRCRTIRSPRR